MARLPTPGQDDGTWGDILNGFLDVAHNSDGTLQNNSVGTAQLQDSSVTATKLSQAYVPASQVGQANGVASLDGTSKISASALPVGATVTDVSNAQTTANQALAGIPYVPSPTDNYLLGWTGPPELFTSNVAPSAGEVYLQRITAVQNGTISNLYFFVTSAGSSVTSGQNFVGLYDSSGTRQGISADCSSTWISTHVAKVPLTAGLSVTKGQQLYVAMIFNGTTMPQLAGGAQSYWDLPNVGGGVSNWTNPTPPYNSLAPNRWRYMSWSSGVTSLPGTIDLDYGNPDKAFWVGVG